MRTGVTLRRGRSASNYYDLVTLKLSRSVQREEVIITLRLQPEHAQTRSGPPVESWKFGLAFHPVGDELEGRDSHVCQPAAHQLTFISDGLIKHEPLKTAAEH
ncbi:hypothetical protein ATANTOWER_025534 [Ataeniobius toweri]|uniref:Uncharacterized protein n=1 Tax=Ataeniobius toweri TaxID=208326 RepID=A0ABU7AIA6_9TELE|nr:hypothetical protein [Ataeniobius toweri]